jgi:hypothetical protein
MIIKVDNGAKEILIQMCDIALKTGGIQNMNAVKAVLDSIQIIEKEYDLDSLDE